MVRARVLHESLLCSPAARARAANVDSDKSTNIADCKSSFTRRRLTVCILARSSEPASRRSCARQPASQVQRSKSAIRGTGRMYRQRWNGRAGGASTWVMSGAAGLSVCALVAASPALAQQADPQGAVNPPQGTILSPIVIKTPRNSGPVAPRVAGGSGGHGGARHQRHALKLRCALDQLGEVGGHGLRLAWDRDGQVDGRDGAPEHQQRARVRARRAGHLGRQSAGPHGSHQLRHPRHRREPGAPRDRRRQGAGFSGHQFRRRRDLHTRLHRL